VAAYDPQADAQHQAGARYDVRVLEPSPPAVRMEPFSDDPTARGTPQPDRMILSPVTDGDATWDELCRERPELAPWCASRWLGAWPRLQPLSSPEAFTTTRDSWHALAEHVICGVRHRATGKIGLRFVRGGFGTPFFGENEAVRVVGGGVVHSIGDDQDRAPITTLGNAGVYLRVPVGVPDQLFKPVTDGDPGRSLPIDSEAAVALADWFGFATSVLAQLRVDCASGAPSLVQLWPEHFDLSIDAGDEASGRRATFGASPGDAEHAEPYLYVSVWQPERVNRDDVYWNEPFGASMPYAALLRASDQRAAALQFFRTGSRLLG
jgi:hypothetical protein